MKKIVKLLFALGLCSVSLGLVYATISWKKSFHCCNSQREVPSNVEVMPVVVVGSGPAGLTAGLYGGRAGIRTIMIMGDKPGGALTETSYVENWPGDKRILGEDLINRMIDHARSWGVEVVNDKAVEIDLSARPFLITLESGKNIYSHALIIATGSSPSLLGVSGEREYWGKGVTTCAICDAPFYKGKDVVVIGGGDSAAEEALQLAPYARNIYVLVRKDYMRAADYLQKRLRAASNIQIVYNTKVNKISGDTHHVSQVTLQDTKTNAIRTQDINGVFLAIGHVPNTQLFKNQLELDDQGRILVQGRSQQASIAGVYAAGDVEDADKQAVIAAGSGSKAMLQALDWLNGQDITLLPVQELEREDESQEKRLQEEVKSPKKLDQQEEVAQLASLTFKKELDDTIANTDKVLIVDFYADYCSSCKRMMPHIKQASQQFKDKVLVYKVNVDEAEELAEAYAVRSLPTILVFKDGKEIKRIRKALSKNEIDNMIYDALKY